MAEQAGFDALDPTAQLKRGLGLLRRSWFLLVSMLGAGLILGFGLFQWMPKEYQSEVKIMLRSRWMLGEGVAGDTTGSNLPTRVRSQLLQDEVKSSAWIEKVLDRLEWPEWARAKRSDVDRRYFVERIKAKINVNLQRGETGERLVFLKFRYSDRYKVRDFLTGLRDQWLAEVFDSHKRDLDREVALRQRNLREMNEELDALRRDLEQFENRQGISRRTQGDSYEERSFRLQEGLDQATLEIAELQAQIDDIDARLAERGPDGELLIPPTVTTLATIANQELQQRLRVIESLTKELGRLRALEYTEKHPDVRLATARLKEALMELGQAPESTAGEQVEAEERENPAYATLRRERDVLQRQLEGKRAVQSRLDSELRRAEGTLATLPLLLNELERRQYNIDLQREAISKASLELQDPVAKQKALESLGPKALPYTTLEEAAVPPGPSSSLGLIAFVAVVAVMLGLGVVVVLARQLLSTSLVDSDQARRALSVPVLGEVAPIRTELEVRRQRLARGLQMAASLLLLLGLATTVWICSSKPELLPTWLVDRAAELREGLL